MTEFQGTIHFQVRVEAEHQHEAVRQFYGLQGVLQDASELKLDAFNVPLVRDMETEGDHQTKYTTTVLVAFEVASPSEGTADCVTHELSGDAMRRSNAELHMEQLRYSLTYNVRSMEAYLVGASQLHERGERIMAESYQKQAAEHKKAADDLKVAIDRSLEENANVFQQGRVTSYTILGSEQAPIEDVVASTLPEPVLAGSSD